MSGQATDMCPLPLAREEGESEDLHQEYVGNKDQHQEQGKNQINLTRQLKWEGCLEVLQRTLLHHIWDIGCALLVKNSLHSFSTSNPEVNTKWK